MIAIITDSTCDLPAETLERLNVRRVPLYVNFKGEVYKDWLEISAKEIVEGVQAGAALPTTSQPSPQDFGKVFKEAVADGATEILCLDISGELSGTVASANLAKEEASVPVTVIDTRSCSVGIGAMVARAAGLRDEGKSMAEIVAVMEEMKGELQLLFSVGSLEFLQKGGRIGRASALLGGLLNIKPILSLNDGTVEAVGRARGAKKALKEMVDRVGRYAGEHKGELIIYFLHVQDEEAVDTLRGAIREAGVSYSDKGSFQIGAVVAAHVGPGTYGLFMYSE